MCEIDPLHTEDEVLQETEIIHGPEEEEDGTREVDPDPADFAQPSRTPTVYQPITVTITYYMMSLSFQDSIIS